MNPETIPTYKLNFYSKEFFNFFKDSIQALEAQRKIMGDTYYLKIFGLKAKILMTSNPNLIKHVLNDNQKNYVRAELMELFAFFVGKSLTTTDGDSWERQRKTMQPAFYKKNIIKSCSTIIEITQDYMKELSLKKGQVLDLNLEMKNLITKVILRLFFNDHGQWTESNKITEYIDDAMQLASKRLNPAFHLWTDFNGKAMRVKKRMKKLDKIILDIIDNRKKSNNTHEDLLQILLDLRYEDTGKPISDHVLKDELVSLFIAGQETTALVLSYAMHSLTKYTEVKQKLIKEIDSVIGERLPCFDDLRQMTYMRQFIDEVMRFYTPLWIVQRKALNSDLWNNHLIDTNTSVFCYFYGLHRNATFWEQPDIFNPDRFAKESIKKRNHHAYKPFGSGPHTCIGMHLAIMEIQLILPLLIRNFKFQLIDQHPIKLAPSLTLQPRNGVQLKIL